MTIKWVTETRRLGDLKAWAHNPRHIRTAEAQRLQKSEHKFGQVDVIAIEPDNTVINGHSRIHVWTQKYGEDHEVVVRVADRPLTDEERGELMSYLHTTATGEWDMDTLANLWDVEDLLEWGWTEEMLGLGAGEEGETDDSLADPDDDGVNELVTCPKCGCQFTVYE